MRITERQLKQIIREERKRILNESKSISPEIIKAAEALGMALNYYGRDQGFDIVISIKNNLRNSDVPQEIINALINAFKRAQRGRDAEYALHYPQDSGTNYLTNFKDMGL
jgi:hypothetical protein